MKKAVALMAIVLTLGMTAALDAEAKRLGGGRPAGMQRQQVTQPAGTPGALPGQAAPMAGAAATAPAAAAAAAQKRSWLGPIAGIAAGLGLAALASHFGFGEALANMLTMALLAMAVLFVVGFFLRKRAQQQAGSLAGAGGGAFGQPVQQPLGTLRETAAPQQDGSVIGSRIGSSLPPASTRVGTIPPDFDAAAFTRNARSQFMALQAANDASDIERLRDFLTPEMLEAVRADLAERGNAPQQTEVFGLEAQVLDVAEEGNRYVVSVRFTGSVREQPAATPEDLDEIWHLVKPRTGFGGWVVAGIQPAKAG